MSLLDHSQKRAPSPRRRSSLALLCEFGGCRRRARLAAPVSHSAPMDQANLRQIPELAKRFDLLAGLSDHTMGTTASVASIALGPCLIEKHVALSRADKGPDSEFSLEPDELDRLCADTRDAWLALGRAGFERQQAEVASKVFRRSLYFVKDLPAGHVIEPGDIRRIRPGMGLAPKYFDEVVGKRLKGDVANGTPVSWDALSGG